MLAYLILLFTVVPLFELYLLIKVGKIIGAFNTIALVILTGVLGAYLAKLEGLSILRKIQHDLNSGIMPAGKLIDGVFVFVAGLLLITPGILTDILGFLFLIPASRNFLKIRFRNKLQDMIKQGRVAGDFYMQPDKTVCPFCGSGHIRPIQSSQDSSDYKCLDCGSRFDVDH